MSKKQKKIISLFLAVIFCGSVYTAVQNLIQIKNSEQAYAHAIAIAKETALQNIGQPEISISSQPKVWREAPVIDDPYMDVMNAINLPALREQNGDVIGWISIPGTSLDYPLMYSADNEFYLDHTWEKKRNFAGAIFLEQFCKTDLSDFNTIIYGHRMDNDTMFTSLKYYSSQEYWNEHPYLYISDGAAHRYEIFSAYKTHVISDTYRLGIEDDNTKQLFIDYCIDSSVIETDIVPTVNDRIVTLSTCDETFKGDYRWVVHARLKAAE